MERKHWLTAQPLEQDEADADDVGDRNGATADTNDDVEGDGAAEIDEGKHDI